MAMLRYKEKERRRKKKKGRGWVGERRERVEGKELMV